MKKRIIPVVLYDGTTVVKGTSFKNERTIGAVEAIANLYSKRRPDEIFFLDVKASREGRPPNFEIFEFFSEKFDIPFAVGGGIRSIDDAKRCVANGAEKVVLGSSVHSNPELVEKTASQLGSQAVVVSLDHWNDDEFVFTQSGDLRTKRTVFEFAKGAEALGAGELLVQDISRDGKMNGLNLARLKEIVEITSIPVIASGGAGSPEHFLEAFKVGVSGVAAGSIFQFTQFTPNQVAQYLNTKGINVRSSL